MLRITRLDIHGPLSNVVIRAIVDLTGKFDLTLVVVSYLAQRGEKTANDEDY